MFTHATREIISHTDIEHRLVQICDDVDPEIVITAHQQLEIPRLRSE
jgi:LmbE family N-acetylglucosaminyl deacetylase